MVFLDVVLGLVVEFGWLAGAWEAHGLVMEIDLS
jgi:hypothetical protein